MIILTREQLSILHSNQPLELHKPLKAKHVQILESGQHIWRCPYHAGQNIPIFRQPDTKGPIGPHACRATIETVEMRDDHWVLQLRIHRTRQEAARLLARRSDALYTSDPHQALPHEPEAIDQDTQHRYSTQGRHTHAQRRLLQDAEHLRGQVHNLDDRITRIEQLAHQRGLDVTSDLRVVYNARDRAARRLDAIEQKIHNQRAA